MLAFTRSKIALVVLTATLAVAQDRSDPILPSRDIGPKVISRVEPKFPNIPRRDPVMVLITVDPKGLPTKIRVVNSYDRGVDEAAISAVQKWRFQAGTQNGVPVDSTLIVSFPAN